MIAITSAWIGDPSWIATVRPVATEQERKPVRQVSTEHVALSVPVPLFSLLTTERGNQDGVSVVAI